VSWRVETFGNRVRQTVALPRLTRQKLIDDFLASIIWGSCDGREHTLAGVAQCVRDCIAPLSVVDSRLHDTSDLVGRSTGTLKRGAHCSVGGLGWAQARNDRSQDRPQRTRLFLRWHTVQRRQSPVPLLHHLRMKPTD
jgi:hypothetical protein